MQVNQEFAVIRSMPAFMVKNIRFVDFRFFIFPVCFEKKNNKRKKHDSLSTTDLASLTKLNTHDTSL